MVDRFADGLSGAVDRIEKQSDRALYPYLQLHILGPYSGDCHAFLTELKLWLQGRRFKRARLCSDRDDTPPDGLTEVEEREFWTRMSYEFLENADVAVFIFLEDELSRESYLPERAFEKEPHGRGSIPQDINASIVEELSYWRRDIGASPDHTLVLFEHECYDEIGSLVEGSVSLANIQYEVFDSHDIERTQRLVHGVAQNWAMDTCKRRLQDRYIEDHR